MNELTNEALEAGVNEVRKLINKLAPIIKDEIENYILTKGPGRHIKDNCKIVNADGSMVKGLKDKLHSTLSKYDGYPSVWIEINYNAVILNIKGRVLSEPDRHGTRGARYIREDMWIANFTNGGLFDKWIPIVKLERLNIKKQIKLIEKYNNLQAQLTELEYKVDREMRGKLNKH